MSTTTANSAEQWAADWLGTVADGSNPMSRRKLASIEKHGGGLDAVRAVAQARGVHLLLLIDDRGSELVAASLHPFKVVC